MKAAVLTRFGGPLEIKDVSKPVPKDNEILVRVGASGLCGTDLHIRDGLIASVKLPHIPGHETAGIVEEVGKNVTELKRGDHVVIAIDRVCCTCRFCRSGRENLCSALVRNGFEAAGGHAEFVAVPQDCAFRISDRIPLVQAAILPDAVACMVHAIYDQAAVKKGDCVCILGMGGLGFQALQILKNIGATVLCTSRKDKKLALAAQMGADRVINTATEELLPALRDATDGNLCDVVFDNIGSSNSIAEGLRICAPGGMVVIVGYAAPEFHGNYQDTMMHEKKIVGMRGSTRKNLLKAIELVESGAVTPFVDQVFPLEQINEAMDVLEQGAALGRIVLVPSGGEE